MNGKISFGLVFCKAQKKKRSFCLEDSFVMTYGGKGERPGTLPPRRGFIFID